MWEKGGGGEAASFCCVFEQKFILLLYFRLCVSVACTLLETSFQISVFLLLAKHTLPWPKRVFQQSKNHWKQQIQVNLWKFNPYGTTAWTFHKPRTRPHRTGKSKISCRRATAGFQKRAKNAAQRPGTRILPSTTRPRFTYANPNPPLSGRKEGSRNGCWDGEGGRKMAWLAFRSA